MHRLATLLYLLPLCGLVGCGRWVETDLPAAETATPAPGPDTAIQPPPALPTADTLPSDARRVLATASAAYRTKLAVIADNLANAETPGFKRAKVVFEDVRPRHERMPGAEDTAGQFAPTGISVGRGVCVSAVLTDFRQGALEHSGRELDVAIEGDGFFQVTDPSGDVRYTRAGVFSRNANGDLVSGSALTGRLLEPAISIPQDATAVVIGADGIVSVRQQGHSQLSQVGQIELARFVNPEGLLRLGENLYGETDSSGPPTLGSPGQDGLGTLRQAALEASNVDLSEESDRWAETLRLAARVERILHRQP